MKRVCALCNGDKGPVNGSARPDNETSHGICGGCLDNFEFQQGVPFQRYIDRYTLPVLVVDRRMVIKVVNRRACKALSKDSLEIVQHLGENVCSSARTRGCRKNTAIRSIVRDARSGGR
jgi:hypothetical protein